MNVNSYGALRCNCSIVISDEVVINSNTEITAVSNEVAAVLNICTIPQMKINEPIARNIEIYLHLAFSTECDSANVGGVLLLRFYL